MKFSFGLGGGSYQYSVKYRYQDDITGFWVKNILLFSSNSKKRHQAIRKYLLHRWPSIDIISIICD